MGKIAEPNDRKKLSKPERDAYKERIEGYIELRKERAGYHQAILTGLLAAFFLYTAEHFLPAVFSKIIQPNSIMIPFLSMFFIGIISLIAMWQYRKSVIQTLKPVCISNNSVATLEGDKVVEGNDGQKYVVAYVSNEMIDYPTDTYQSLDDAGIKPE